MGWNKDGSTIKGLYLSEYPVTGKVIESRVRYGGSVSYFVELTEAFYMRGQLRDHVILDENQVTADFGVLNEAEQV